MIIIQPDGTVTEAAYVDYRSITKAVNLPGGDDPFTGVPLPERTACGYTVWANDVGLLVGMEANLYAEELCQYGPLVGPICVTTFEEAKEEDLLGEIVPEMRKQFEERLKDVITIAKTATAARDN